VYDDLVRISSVNCGPTSPNGSTWTQSFTYDPFGNINKSGSLSFLPTYTGSASTPTTNQFYQIPGGPAGASNYYDLNGNLTTDVTNTYSWDADGNSVKINSIGLAYDALDRRVEQNNAGTYTQILYSPIGKLALMNKQTATNVFLPLPGGEQATYTNSTVRFRHYDWQGSARLESNMAEHEYGDLAYAPFGESYAILNTPYPSFTGQQQDTVPGSGLYDFLYREYSAVQGRWNSPDPAGFGAADPSNPQSWNRYAYALNNPLRYKDPSGLILCDYGPSDNGGEDFEDADDPNECTSNGGTLPTDRTTVTVNGDSPGDVDTIENGQQIYPQIVQSYAANNGPTAPVVLKNPCSVQGRALPPGAYVTQGQQANGSTVNFALDVAMGWPKGDYLDAQPLASGNVFQNQAYGNYVFGVYMSAEGASLSGTLSGASAFSLASGAYFTYTKNGYQMDPNYPLLPAANVGNITNGYNAQQNGTGTVCHN
jgi:RHS repeat-associated protein